MRWRRRTDDARRMKGDPPPTYDEIVALLRIQEEISRNLANQRDNLIKENADLRAQNKALRESNLRLLNDANLMRQRLPGLATAFFYRTPVQFWICSVEGHTVVEWRGDVAHCMTYGCGRTSADPAVDEAVTRPYIPDYEDREQPWTEER